MDAPELSQEEAEQRANQARNLLADPMLQDAFNETEKALLRAAKLTKTKDEAERAVLALQSLELVKAALYGHIETGKVMEHNFRRKKFGVF